MTGSHDPKAPERVYRRCSHCRRSEAAMTKPVVARWDQLGGGLCPRCWDMFHGMPAPAKKRPTCAGCGRTGKLTGGRCQRCRGMGIEAQPLFGEFDPTKLPAKETAP